MLGPRFVLCLEYSFLGVHLIPDYWKTDEALRSLHSTPLLLIHGEMDEVIPVAHGKELFEEFQGLKMSAFSEEASHNEYFIVDVSCPTKQTRTCPLGIAFFSLFFFWSLCKALDFCALHKKRPSCLRRTLGSR